MTINTDNLKARFNIVDVIEGYIGQMKKAGKNYHACCPFHTEKTPSFTVSEDKQFYHCFGCGAHGDVIAFVAEYGGMEFTDAVKVLDANAFDEVKPGQQVQIARVARLPLSQEIHHEAKEMLEACQSINGKHFNNQYLVLPLTDTYGTLVSLGLVEGRGFDVRFLNQNFLLGSCYIMSKNPGKEIWLTADYWQASNLSHLRGLNTVCYFDPMNIYYIVSELNKHKELYTLNIICNSEEDLIQADKMNLTNVFRGGLGERIGMENV